MKDSLRVRLDRGLGFVFSPAGLRRSNPAQALVLAMIFLAGAAGWWGFLKCNDEQYFPRALDWDVECQYYSVLQEMFRSGQIPWSLVP